MRKDGTRRRYVCKSVHTETGECGLPSIDAEVLERGVLSDLEDFRIDVGGWIDALASHQDAERAAVEELIARDDDRLTAARRRERMLQGRWLDAMDAADERLEQIAFEARSACPRTRRDTAPDPGATGSTHVAWRRGAG